MHEEAREEAEAERWRPRQLRDGTDPDPRFTLANERTLLAWLRTTLALLAAGVAVDVVDIGVPDPMTRALAAMLLTLGALCPLLAFARWAMAERAGGVAGQGSSDSDIPATRHPRPYRNGTSPIVRRSLRVRSLSGCRASFSMARTAHMTWASLELE